jgi:hypothetical protein
MTQQLFLRYDGHDWDTVDAPSPTMYSQGAFASNGDSLFCAWRGATQIYSARMLGIGRTWTSALPIPAAQTTTSPALAVMPDGTVLCVYQNGGVLQWSAYSESAGTWGNGAAITLPNGAYLDGISSTTSPVLIVFNGMLYLFYQLYNTGGNLRCATYDGAQWTQVGGKGNNFPITVVPGMSNSPTAAVFQQKIYCLYQGYKANKSLTGTVFDGVATWTNLPADIAGAVMSGSPSAATVPPATVGASDADKVNPPAARLWAFYQDTGNPMELTGISTADGVNWKTEYESPVGLVPGTTPSAGYWPGNDIDWPAHRAPWLVVNCQIEPLQPPNYPNSTKMTDAAAQALLTKFAPVVYLSRQEQYFPASIDWYLPRVTMNFQGNNILEQVTAASLSTQNRGDQYSYLIPDGTGGYIEAHDFQLSIVQESTYSGMPPPIPGQPQAPFYGVVIDNPDMSATDLLFMFFYAYNGLAGRAFYEIGVHEADLEHVIIRLSQDQSTIVGMYCQAHASDDAFSQWYYPPSSSEHPNFTFYDTSNQHPTVYSAAESHASYTAAGEFAMGWKGWKGQDSTDPGYLWNSVANVIRVSLNETSWLQYSGRWGATDGGVTLAGTSPDGPAGQGWLKPKKRFGAATAAAMTPRRDGPLGA